MYYLIVKRESIYKLWYFSIIIFLILYVNIMWPLEKKWQWMDESLKKSMCVIPAYVLLLSLPSYLFTF